MKYVVHLVILSMFYGWRGGRKMEYRYRGLEEIGRSYLLLVYVLESDQQISCTKTEVP